MCTRGMLGLRRCAISEMPEAQNRGSSAAPGICARNSGANSPCTVEQCTPTFSNSRPRITLITPPPPGRIRIKRSRRVVFEPLEGPADVVAQALEPGSCPRFAGLDHGNVHLRCLTFFAGYGTSFP